MGKAAVGVRAVQAARTWQGEGDLSGQVAKRRSDGAEVVGKAAGLDRGDLFCGLLANECYGRAWLERIGAGTASSLQYEAALDAVADTLSAAVDLDALFGAARRPSMATRPTA